MLVVIHSIRIANKLRFKSLSVVCQNWGKPYNTITFNDVSVHTFAKIGVGYPISVVYIRISS